MDSREQNQLEPVEGMSVYSVDSAGGCLLAAAFKQEDGKSSPTDLDFFSISGDPGQRRVEELAAKQLEFIDSPNFSPSEVVVDPIVLLRAGNLQC